MTTLTEKDILVMPREELRTFKKFSDFDVENLTMGKDSRLSVYTRPIAGHQYVAGMDAAWGIEGRDYDALIVNDISTDPIEQVAELEGRWGVDRFDRLVYCMLKFYRNAFLCGERQVGLATLRSLINNFEYGYLYYERNEATKGRRRQDILGHHRTAGDLTIPQFMRAVRDKAYRFRSERFWQQVRAYQFRPKGKLKEKTEDMRDADLVMGAPPGENDDLCLAGAYAWKAALEIHRFEDERPQFEEGTAGDVLGMAVALEEKPKYPPRTAFTNLAPKPRGKYGTR